MHEHIFFFFFYKFVAIFVYNNYAKYFNCKWYLTNLLYKNIEVRYKITGIQHRLKVATSGGLRSCFI